MCDSVVLRLHAILYKHCANLVHTYLPFNIALPRPRLTPMVWVFVSKASDFSYLKSDVNRPFGEHRYSSASTREVECQLTTYKHAACVVEL